MTVKYYPLFFMLECGMTPVGVQCVYLGVPLCMLVFGSIMEPSAKRLGRAQVITLFKALGVGFLFVFVWLQSKFESHPYFVLVPPFLLTTAFTDSTYPIEESILMDFVPKKRRGRWKSLESVSTFGWCGSSVLGGYLVDHQGYTAAFFVTAVIQTGAVAIWVLLLYMVPKKEMRAHAAHERNEAAPSTKEDAPLDTTEALFHVEEIDRTREPGGDDKADSH